jgi:hypothetical protein
LELGVLHQEGEPLTIRHFAVASEVEVANL